MTNNNNNLNIIQDINTKNWLKNTQKNIDPDKNKDKISLNKNLENNNNFQFNFYSYKCQLSQKIDQVEKIASQSMNNIDSSPNFNKLIRNKENININININNNFFLFLNNNLNHGKISDHQIFNK